MYNIGQISTPLKSLKFEALNLKSLNFKFLNFAPPPVKNCKSDSYTLFWLFQHRDTVYTKIHKDFSVPLCALRASVLNSFFINTKARRHEVLTINH